MGISATIGVQMVNGLLSPVKSPKSETVSNITNPYSGKQWRSGGNFPSNGSGGDGGMTFGGKPFDFSKQS